jgi:C-terminal processing protease CtpA/Prc
MRLTAPLFLIWLSLAASAEGPNYGAAARSLDETIATQYAYSEKLPGGLLPQSSKLDAERVAVHDGSSLLRYAENRIASLADHHAITGSSFKNSWAVVPTYADLWIVKRDGDFVVDAVREGSPAEAAGVKANDLLVAIDGTATNAAVQTFWSDLGLTVTSPRAEFAARVLVAGRRDRDRRLRLADPRGKTRDLTLRSLYALPSTEHPPISMSATGNRTLIRFNNSLGDDKTIIAFDAAIARIPQGDEIILDVRDTPSGGNTSVARAVMGWFVDRPTGYQVHNRPVEQRETGIARQWVEQVLPREGKHRMRLPTILVGRWTGSMGEGLAIGFSAMGAKVQGTQMAGLNGSVEDIAIQDTGLSIKLPTERLLTTAYQPREDFVPKTPR